MKAFNPPSETELNYRDDRDIAHVQVRNVTRRIFAKLDAAISLEHAQAELEGREAQIDTSREGIAKLVIEYTNKTLGTSYVAIEG